MLLANRILHILCIFIKPNVWYWWRLKILAIKRWFPFNFAKTLRGRHFVKGWPKTFKLLVDTFFENSLQNTVLPSLLLFLCASYYVDLDDIQWTEVATSTARNFNNSWPLYLNFSNMINLCPNIWFIKNSKCHQFVFWKRSRQKTQICNILKGPLFRYEWPYWYEFRQILRNFCWLSKKKWFWNFSQNMNVDLSIWISKVGQNSTAFKK